MDLRLAVFDVGGVLIRICHTWADAAELAGVSCGVSNPGRLSECPFLDAYQDGSLSVEGYLEELRAHLGLSSREDALKVHNHILVEEYPGMLGLIEQIKAQGIRTACLSNTAQLHWTEMGESGRFPAFNALDFTFASHIEKVNKPNLEIYLRVQEKAGVGPESIIFFDDYERNIAGAEAAGWKGWKIDPNFSPTRQISEILSDFSIIIH